MNEWTRIAQWLTETLGGQPDGGGTPPHPMTGLAGGVHEHPAPQAATYPLITFQSTAPDDLTVIGEDRVWADDLVLVTGIVEGQSTTPALGAIADEIDARLHGAQFGSAGDDATILACVRERYFSLSVLEEGKSFRRLGGYFRLLAQPIST